MSVPAKNKTASKPLSQEQEDHREWIGGRVWTLLGHYYRPDDPIPMTAALGRDWSRVLEKMPQDAIDEACIVYLRNNERQKPTPGEIYKLAAGFARITTVKPPEPERIPLNKDQKMSDEAREEMMSKAGYNRPLAPRIPPRSPFAAT